MEFFTLMHQQQAGLQILSQQIENGTAIWVDASLGNFFYVIAGDIFERFTNGVVRALPHRVINTPHYRNSIIRFNALHPATIVSPLPQFISNSRPKAYSDVTMKRHMETTMSNLKLGKGAWASGSPGYSLTATYVYD